MTHLDQIRKENQQVKSQIETLLGWNNSTFCHFQEAMGYTYLKDELGSDFQSARELVYMKTFWNWWKNQWVKRDMQFLKDVMATGKKLPQSIYRKERIESTYMQYHKANSILFSPHKETMRASYCRFIGRTNKEVVNG
jgi:hypothetical protein